MEAFSDMKAPAFVLGPQQIADHLRQMAAADHSTLVADRHVREHYAAKPSAMIWIDRQGADHRADTLLAWLHRVSEMGFTERSFMVDDIEHDLLRLRTLDFDEQKNTASRVAARLEYQLTKACLRYCYGQRFGFINPHRLFNYLDIDKQDSLRGIIRYRGLFDVEMDLPDSHYADSVMQLVKADRIARYLQEIQPTESTYRQLKDMLPTATGQEQRQRVIVNMERSRWRRHQPLMQQGKRVVVNIPAYHLYAYAEDSVLDMRVVCGARTTKTPQLSSHIAYMQVNPECVIPMSIIKNEVAPHAGDSSWFARRRYEVVNKETRQTVDLRNVTRQMLLSGKYNVAQKGGAGNSLGRIVFRFKNNFSVYLHDTNTPGAFSRDVRSLSHGCVRVSKPFQLAQFVLDNPDEWLLDRIRVGMGLPAETERGLRWLSDHPDHDDVKKLIGYVGVEPRVPIYIIYYTIWPDEGGTWQTWPDIYGYDQVMWNALKPYMQ